MVRLVYSILLAICMPFVLLRLWMRGLSAPEYRTRRLERLGFFEAPDSPQDLWVHAVSVGELLAAEPIIRELKKRYPAKKITVTTMTPTSSALLTKLFGDEVFHVYAPYDVPIFVRAFFNRIKPKHVVIMETELWPNILNEAQRRSCPVVLANARLSERSARGYRRFLSLIGWLFDGLDLVLCQFEADALRFRSLGIPAERIHVTGSVKFDMELDPALPEQGKSLRKHLSDDKAVWIAASTHEGEDAKVLNVHKKLKAQFPELLLIIVPRHPERFDSAYQASVNAGFRTARYSRQEDLGLTDDVFVLDTMGQLMRFYAASDLVFIGGSFAEIGGHNPIEPGALGKPMLIGPHYFNFEMICTEFFNSGALLEVKDEDALESELTRMLGNPVESRERGQAAIDVVRRGRGATGRVVDLIAPLF